MAGAGCRRTAHGFLLLVAGFDCALSCGTSGTPLHPDNPPGSWYIVREGDTLADIATRAAVPLEDLIEINGLSKSDTVREGQIIYLLDADGLRRPTRPRPLAELDAHESAAPRASPSSKTPNQANWSPSSTTAPLRWPVAQPRLTSAFGQRQGRAHEGIDLGAPTGTPIYAAKEGSVLYAGDAVRGYGNMVVLQHAGDLLTVYAHNSVLLVKPGDKIASGQEIARAGQSGHATAPHLHFEVRRGQVPSDPLKYLPPLR